MPDYRNGSGEWLEITGVKKRNLTQKEVADILHVHENTIGGYENNTRAPSLENVVALAVLYNASEDFILGMDKRTNLDLDDLTAEQKEFISDTIAQYRRFFKLITKGEQMTVSTADFLW